MRVVFVTELSPPGSCGSIIRGVGPSLAVASLASRVRQENNVECFLVDTRIGNLSTIQTASKIVELKPDLVTLGLYTCQLDDAADLCAELRRFGIFNIVVGGPHATAVPDETMAITAARWVISGEGELSLSALVRNLNTGLPLLEDIPGLSYVDDQEKIVIKPPTCLTTDELDQLPLPAWDLFDLQWYWKNDRINDPSFTSGLRPLPVITARGCPMGCKYCREGASWKTYRPRSISKVVDELQHWQRTLDIDEFMISDPAMNANMSRLKELCREIIRRDIKVNLKNMVGSLYHNYDRETLSLMKKAGYYSVIFGVESSSEANLRRLGRPPLNRKVLDNTVNTAKSLGLMTRAYFILGLPDETIKDMWSTIQFARRLNIDGVRFHPFTPMPGTPIFDELKKRSHPDCEIRRKSKDFHLLKCVANVSAVPTHLFKLLYFLAPFYFWFSLRRLRGLFKLIIYTLKLIIKRASAGIFSLF